MDCQFVAEAKTDDGAIESLMRHVHEEHGDDWFEIEEIYQAASQMIRRNVA